MCIVGNGLDRSENLAVYAVTGFITRQRAHNVHPYGGSITNCSLLILINSSLLTPTS